MQTKEFAAMIRINALKMTGKSGASHIASILSATDIVATLYNDVLRYDVGNFNKTEHDHFILSKGHAGVAVYCALAIKGFFPLKDLEHYYGNGSLLSGHISSYVHGVECSTGALGHGAGIGVGLALAQKINKSKFRTYVLLGDGECNEGSVWEAAMFAASQRLDNLTFIIDRNRMQALGKTEDIIPQENIRERFQAFGFNSLEVDGHDYAALKDSLLSSSVEGRPIAVIANTIKGKGVSFMENELLWHYRDPRGEFLERALKEVEQQL